MTAPSYVSDLAAITDGSEGSAYTEPTNATLGTLSGATPDTDNFIQGTNCVSKTTGASGAPALAGIGYLHASPQSIVTPSCVYAWMFVGGGGLIESYANGGLRVIVGNTSANYKQFRVLGSDTFPYIGWVCVAVDPSLASDPAAVGSPSATLQYFGAVWSCKINIGKGNPMALDAMRWGRTITVTLGDLGGYATFAGIAAVNDTVTNRWGQFQAIPGGYQLQGRLLLGVTGGAVVDFRDQNVSFVTAVSLKVAAAFNAIEIQNASSRVDWTSVSWSALGTVSRGTFTVTDDADVNFSNCTFTDLSTFSLKPATDMLGCTWRRCGVITAGGANLSGSRVDSPTAATNTAALVWNVNTDTNGKLDNMTFVKGAAAHHAIELGTSCPTTITLTGQRYSGFGADGTDSAVLLLDDRGSNTAWTINYPGGDLPTYKKVRSGDTVSLVATVNVTLTGLVNPTEVRVYSRDGSGNSDTELQGTEDVTTGSFAFSLSAGVHVNIVVYSVGYLPVYFTDYVMPSVNASVPVQQIFDRQYANP